MKTRKFVSMGTAILTAAVLWSVPVWAAEQDTGYPWFADVAEENNQLILQPNTSFKSMPVTPGEEDTGYPWYSDIKEDPITKRVKVFGVHPRTEEGDTGYPWHADINGDDGTLSKPGKTTQ